MELSVMEQRYEAVNEVLQHGLTVVEVAAQYRVSRQTVHKWLRRYDTSGLAGLEELSHRPTACPHQMPAKVEARVVQLRRAHPEWGPARLAYQLGRDGFDSLPGLTSIYRALVRNRLIEPVARRRQKADYRRWERGRPMELWQMDVMGLRLADGAKVSVITGLDDHSRFCVSARVVARADARSVCDALADALRRYGLPDEILTDNGKVFTGRFGPGRVPVMFDRICLQHGVTHRLTAPRSPTTTGKIERFHLTLRLECLAKTSFRTISDAQQGLDAYLAFYNQERPHQALGMVPPAQRFRFDEEARALPPPVIDQIELVPLIPVPPSGTRPGAAADRVPAATLDQTSPGQVVTRLVTDRGLVTFAGAQYSAGRRFAGRVVTIGAANGAVRIHYRGEFIRSWPSKHRAASEPPPGAELELQAMVLPEPIGDPFRIHRRVARQGTVGFAGAIYSVGRRYAGLVVDVEVKEDKVRFLDDGRVLKTHPLTRSVDAEHLLYRSQLDPPSRSRQAV